MPRAGGAEQRSAPGTPWTRLAEAPSPRGSSARRRRPRKPGAWIGAEQGAPLRRVAAAEQVVDLAGASPALRGRNAHCAAGLAGL
ncbi:RAD51-associated protein 2 isoform X3 [Cervus canadensis]|uniref:RAD51-associated protein 2 isoform X3 n=1 Tax=Cervus canadensis TaxID=1574408 RepID=UPI001C9E69E1|nr:RAD51-associated protein 2 isoform X3 [Cervus canadensis]